MVFLFDNATSHVTTTVENFLVQENCVGILNAPYCPELNYAEIYIKLHKSILKKLIFETK